MDTSKREKKISKQNISLSITKFLGPKFTNWLKIKLFK